MSELLPRPRPLLIAFLVASAVQVAAVAADWQWLDVASKPFLVALLLAWAWVACDRRPPRLLAVGLVLAWLGDLLLQVSGTAWFLAGMAAFLGMQVCYIRGFAGLGAGRRLRSRPWVVAVWAVLWLGLNLVLGPSLGELRWPILVYSLALVTMAAYAVATGVAAIGVGGVLFLVSDLLIGLRAADVELPASGVLVMTTYCLAQYLIVTGWVGLVRSRDTADARVAA